MENIDKINRWEFIEERLKKDGIKAIEDFLMDKEAEGYFLDFKKTEFEDYSSRGKLGNKDREILAKSISGFGNSEGGILVYGVDANGKIHDFASSSIPITSPHNFRSLVNREIYSLTIPGHPTVDSFVIEDPSNSQKGYIVIVIPKYEGVPIQTFHEEKFYMRIGSCCKPIPHSILTGMFGKRPNPNLIVEIEPDKDRPQHALKASGSQNEFDIVDMNFSLSIKNIGKGIAKNVFINIDFKGISGWNADCCNDNFTQSWMKNGIKIVSTKDFKIGPEQEELNICSLDFSARRPFDTDFKLEILIVTENQVPNRIIFETKKEMVKKLCDNFLKNPSGTDNRNEFLKNKIAG